MAKTNRTFRWLLVTALLAAGAAAWAQSTAPAAPRKVSVDRQLMLKRQLLTGADSQGLLATIRGNVGRWEALTPEQRQSIRNQAWASLRDSSETEQAAILDSLRQFQQLSTEQQEQYRRRAAWLRDLMALLSDQQKSALLQMPAAERAKEIVKLRREFQEAGKLPADEPTPATRPAPIP